MSIVTDNFLLAVMYLETLKVDNLRRAQTLEAIDRISKKDMYADSNDSDTLLASLEAMLKCGDEQPNVFSRWFVILIVFRFLLNELLKEESSLLVDYPNIVEHLYTSVVKFQRDSLTITPVDPLKQYLLLNMKKAARRIEEIYTKRTTNV
jgi:hypothetical protein